MQKHSILELPPLVAAPAITTEVDPFDFEAAIASPVKEPRGDSPHLGSAFSLGAEEGAKAVAASHAKCSIARVGPTTNVSK